MSGARVALAFTMLALSLGSLYWQSLVGFLAGLALAYGAVLDFDLWLRGKPSIWSSRGE